MHLFHPLQGSGDITEKGVEGKSGVKYWVTLFAKHDVDMAVSKSEQL